MSDYEYQGSELDLFQHAVNWKRYYASQLQPYITGDVLEVGAGLGGTSRFLCRGTEASWTCLEPDRSLLEEARRRLVAERLADRCEFVCGTTASFAPARRFGAILYIDVLEHIEDDRGELRGAAEHLAPGGVIVVLAPAHQALFTEFDRALGHFRRYDKASLAAVAPADLRRERLFYVDAAGLAASLGNRLFLRQALPTPGQVAVWERRLVPLSRVLDKLLGWRIGKSIIGVWRKPR